MHTKKTPVYVVCGASGQEQLDFFHRFCRAERPLLVRMERGAAPDTVSSEDAVSCALPPDAAGAEIARRVERERPAALWVLWDDSLAMDYLFAMTRQAELTALCGLKRILRCGGGETLMHDAGNAALRPQLAQCDLLAVDPNDGGELRKLRRRVTPMQPGIQIYTMSDASGIAAALERRSPWRNVQFALLLVAVAALFMAVGRLSGSLSDSLATFLGTYLQALPFLILGIFLSSVIQVFVPADLLQRLFPKKLLPGMLFGVLGGFILPICDCASIPVFRSLVRKGVPLPAAVTFMIAAPIINPVVLLSTFYAFGGSVKIMLTRMGFGIVCSVIIGLCFAREKRSVFVSGENTAACVCGHSHEHAHIHAHTHADEHCHEEHAGLREERCACGHCHTGADSHGGGKLAALLSHFQTEFFEVARFLLIGIGVSTALQLAMGSRIMNMRISNLAVSMLVMMALAFFLSLCSSSDAVVGKNMGASLPLGAVMGFMVFGPMIDVKNMILMAASFTRRFMVKLLIVTFLVSFATVYAAFALGLQGMIV